MPDTAAVPASPLSAGPLSAGPLSAGPVSNGPTSARARTITVTDAAARRILEVTAREANPALMLRLSVSGGGCAGFRYGFALDDNRTGDDIILEHQGARVVIDDGSLDLLIGATLDYEEDLMGASFRVVNPNATSSCGCGASFGA